MLLADGEQQGQAFLNDPEALRYQDPACQPHAPQSYPAVFAAVILTSGPIAWPWRR
jgi:hypothetical protein